MIEFLRRIVLNLNLIAIGKQYLNGRVCLCHSVKGVYMCPNGYSLVLGSKKREPERPKFHLVSPQSVCNSSTSSLQSGLRVLT
jgi:hypothetical protein